LTRVDREVWRKELKDHAELYDKLKARMPRELYDLRADLEGALQALN
jgi:GTP-dependent phosphoenolpyruvate carboxykinase